MQPMVIHVEADAEPDGSLSVQWDLDGGPAAVDVAIGPSPEQIDHEHQLTVPSGTTHVRLPGLGRGRWYVSVAPSGSGAAVVAADRRVAFEGITNFRDLGGYRTVDGGRTRWGMVFRADALAGMTERDLALYERLAVRTVTDLRGDEERATKPNPFDSHHVALIGPQVDDPDERPAEATGEELLHHLYVRLFDHAGPLIGQVIGSLATDEGLPTVFHCHAGKDRTGVIAALLLEALGVPRSVVLDDYEATARYRVHTDDPETHQKLIELGMLPEVAAGILSAPRWAMAASLDHLDERHGGVHAYLTGPAGLTDDRIDWLRSRLVDPAPVASRLAV